MSASVLTGSWQSWDASPSRHRSVALTRSLTAGSYEGGYPVALLTAHNALGGCYAPAIWRGRCRATPIVQWGRANAGMISVENRRMLCLVDSPP
jgi:hypothetical protein